MDGFIETGSGGGIGFGLCDDICHAVIDEEKIISRRVYHTLTEAKNGAGAVPIRGKKCWINIAHGVRNTAAGLRYVLYAFATDIKDPSKVIAEPSGVFLVQMLYLQMEPLQMKMEKSLSTMLPAIPECMWPLPPSTKWKIICSTHLRIRTDHRIA